MENLKKLDLRFNDVDIINRPETQSIEELFLSGRAQASLSIINLPKCCFRKLLAVCRLFQAETFKFGSWHRNELASQS